MGRKALAEASCLPCRHSTRRRRLSAKTTAEIKASELRAFAVLLDFHGDLCVSRFPVTKLRRLLLEATGWGPATVSTAPKTSSSFLGEALKLDRPKSSSYIWELQFPESSETRCRHSAKTLFPRSLRANSHPHWKNPLSCLLLKILKAVVVGDAMPRAVAIPMSLIWGRYPSLNLCHFFFQKIDKVEWSFYPFPLDFVHLTGVLGVYCVKSTFLIRELRLKMSHFLIYSFSFIKQATFSLPPPPPTPS